jgi:tRNA(Ile)-lysidine synthase
LAGGPPCEPLARRAKKKQDNCVADLFQRVENSIRDRKLLKRGEKILVAVSGGLDSMVLLHALKKLSARHKWKIVVAHFNHQLRGRASDTDEKLVRKMAAAMKLPLVFERADVKKFAAQSKLSIEMAARKLRHEFFARIARKQKIKTIALAHHADDQVELFFLRLLRGAGGEGLAGMKWHSPSPADRTISIVRPLLDFSKSELAEFARENKIQFWHDATNFFSDFLRNRIRNELLPLLRKNYQPGLDKTILRVIEITGAESEFIGRSSERQFAQNKNQSRLTSAVTKKNFEGLPIAIQRRILQSQLMELGVAADFELVEQLRESAGKFVSVGPGLSISRDANGGLKLREQQLLEFNINELEVNLAGKTRNVNFDGGKFSWIFSSGSRGRSPHKKQIEFFDADKIGGKIILRHWHSGDRFQPIGLKSPAKLQDLFTNAKIPRERRRNLILAATLAGEIFWVEGLRISENFKLTQQTKRQLVWHWQGRISKTEGGNFWGSVLKRA